MKKNLLTRKLNIVNRVYEYSFQETSSYFNHYYNEYLFFLDKSKVIFKDSFKKLKKENENITSNIKELTKEIEGVNNLIVKFISKWIKTSEIKILQGNLNFKYENEEYKTKENIKIFFENLKANLVKKNFILNKEKKIKDLNKELLSLKKEINLKQKEIIYFFSLRYPWVFKLKYDFSKIEKRTSRIYRTKIYDMKKITKKNSSSNNIIKDFVQNFYDLFELNNEDFKNSMESLKNEINIYNIKISKFLNEISSLKNRLNKILTQIINDIYFDSFNIKEKALFFENKSKEDKLDWNSELHSFIINVFGKNSKTFISFEKELFFLNKKISSILEKENIKLLKLNSVSLRRISLLISDINYILGHLFVQNMWFKDSSVQFVEMVTNNTNLLNEIISETLNN